MMRRRPIVSMLIGGAVALSLSLSVLTLPAGANPGYSMKVTPDTGLVKGETVTVTGAGFPYSTDGGVVSYFMAECTSKVTGALSATDTGHCNIGAVQSVTVTQAGTFSTKLKLVTGTVGDGYCGTKGHLTCVIGVGDTTADGTAVQITFKAPKISKHSKSKKKKKKKK
jgi:hypothetical protein